MQIWHQLQNRRSRTHAVRSSRLAPASLLRGNGPLPTASGSIQLLFWAVSDLRGCLKVSCVYLPTMGYFLCSKSSASGTSQ